MNHRFLPQRLLIHLLIVAALGCIVKVGLTRSAASSHYAATALGHFPAQMSADQIAQKALSLSAFSWGPNEVVGSPMLCREDIGLTHGLAPNQFWQVACRSSDFNFDLTYNDKTGHLYWLCGTMQNRQTAQVDGPVVTPFQAERLAATRLQQLHVLPGGSQARLKAKPERARGGTAWKMTWQVTPPHALAAYPVGVILDAETGVPVEISNTHETN